MSVGVCRCGARFDNPRVAAQHRSDSGHDPWSIPRAWLAARPWAPRQFWASLDAEPACWGVYELPLRELDALPTLAQGQADDLKIESDTERVWLARTGVEDGEPWNHKVTVERRIAGSWIEVERWEAR